MSRYVDIEPYEDYRIAYYLEDYGFPCSELPTADVKPVVHAYWRKECKSQITFPNGEVATLVERQCSNCLLWSNKEIMDYMPKEAAKWCPACGAKMDGKEDT